MFCRSRCPFCCKEIKQEVYLFKLHVLKKPTSLQSIDICLHIEEMGWGQFYIICLKIWSTVDFCYTGQPHFC